MYSTHWFSLYALNWGISITSLSKTVVFDVIIAVSISSSQLPPASIQDIESIKEDEFSNPLQS